MWFGQHWKPNGLISGTFNTGLNCLQLTSVNALRMHECSNHNSKCTEDRTRWTCLACRTRGKINTEISSLRNGNLVSKPSHEQRVESGNSSRMKAALRHPDIGQSNFANSWSRSALIIVVDASTVVSLLPLTRQFVSIKAHSNEFKIVSRWQNQLCRI